MPRQARKQSESCYYHVINRGSGKQLIFETESDYRYFLSRLKSALEDSSAQLVAWCLMDNHYHLLLKIEFEELPTLMHKVQAAYAGYFNRVYNNCGPVFQGRFRSEPIESDEYLLSVVRYIHQNPSKAGLTSTCKYKWSSYLEYTNPDSANFASTEFVLGMLGGTAQFIEFHQKEPVGETFLDYGFTTKHHIPDDQALALSKSLLGNTCSLRSLKALDKHKRDSLIKTLKEHGLTVRQIQRLTGISLGIISAAGK